LKNIEIQAAIKQRLEDEAMDANEVLRRLAKQARFDLTPYITHGIEGYDIDVEQLMEDGHGDMIKSIVVLRKYGGTKVELHDAQTALLNMGKRWKLFTDKLQIGGDPEEPLTGVITIKDFRRKVEE